MLACKCLQVARIAATALLVLFFAGGTYAEESGLEQELLGYEFPEPADLTPVYPGPDDNAIASFRVRLHKDFSDLAVSGRSETAYESLRAYLNVRDQWLESGSLTKCILAGAITAALDEYLIRMLPELPGLSPENEARFNALALRNNLTGNKLFGALDDALHMSGSHHKGILELCAEKKVMPQEACWVTYIQQFGLGYQRISLESVKVVFLDKEIEGFQQPIGRLGLYEKITRNPVFVLHVKEPSYLIQFTARVLDGIRIRDVAWAHALDKKTGLEKNLQSKDLTQFLDALAPPGVRWLASESYADELEVNLEFFARKVNPGMRETDYLSPIGDADALLFKQFMEMVGVSR